MPKIKIMPGKSLLLMNQGDLVGISKIVLTVEGGGSTWNVGEVTRDTDLWSIL